VKQVYLPTLKQLQYLVALAGEENFGRAAERCGVTQSTLSSGIAELERLLGVILIERNRRVVRFTDLGSSIAAQATRILDETEVLADIVRASGEPLTGDLRLSVIPTIAPFVLPRLVTAVKRDYPGLRLFLREEMSGEACASLSGGRSDCILLALPYVCGDVEQEHIADDAILLAARSDDPTVITAATPAEAIDPERMLLLEDGHCLKDHAISACNRPDVAAGARMMGTSLHTLVQMVDGGIGMTMIPQMAVDAGILDGTDVEARNLGSPDAKRAIALVWRKASPRERDFRLLASTIRSILGTEG
jgi:LysR family hydrogen peroxide-inducible transcriptional activator